MDVYIVTINHEDGNHSVWSTLSAATEAAKALLEDDRVYETWVERWVVDAHDPKRDDIAHFRSPSLTLDS